MKKMNVLLLSCSVLLTTVNALGSPVYTFKDPEIGEFRELLVDSKAGAIFVGAEGGLFRLWAYNINDTSDNVFSKKSLILSEVEETECRSMVSDESQCRPSTRFLTFSNNLESLFVCSSVGMKPEIRVLDSLTLKDQQQPRTEIGICVPNTNVNATAVLVESGNPDDVPSVYSGIRTGMAGENHLIYRPPLTRDGRQLHASIRTMYTDNKWLNEPQFVGSFEAGSYVYFFFREIAHENMMGERVTHSRVARVCKKDMGGRNVLRQVWTSFVKARLNCSISAQTPFYFDHIQSVTKVERDGTINFVATFTTSDAAFVSSAVCVFPLASINSLMDNGLMTEETKNGYATISADQVPDHRPGTCSSNSHSISDSDLHFARTHLLMAEAVTGGLPILPARDVYYTHILVDVLAQQNVLFIIDSLSRKLWKVTNYLDGNEWKAKLLEERDLKVTSKIHSAAILSGEYFYTTTREGVAQFSVAECTAYTSCVLCSTDPYCSWNAANSSCHLKQKSHEKSVGWISTSWPDRAVSECSAVEKPTIKDVYMGDAVRLKGIPKSTWTKDGERLEDSEKHVFTPSGGDLIILNINLDDIGQYECTREGTVLTKYRLAVHDNCVKPATVSEYRSCQREWCKKADQYKSAMNLWAESNKRNVQCVVNESTNSF